LKGIGALDIVVESPLFGCFAGIVASLLGSMYDGQYRKRKDWASQGGPQSERHVGTAVNKAVLVVSEKIPSPEDLGRREAFGCKSQQVERVNGALKVVRRRTVSPTLSVLLFCLGD
jgi:hypothetical protein